MIKGYQWPYVVLPHGGWVSISHVAVAGGSVFAGSEDGLLTCINAATGEYNWSDLASPIDTAPAVAGGLVYFGSGIFSGISNLSYMH